MISGIVETVRRLGNHDRDVLGFVGVINRVVQLQLAGQLAELLLKPAAGRVGGEVDHEPHEVHILPHVGILAAEQDIELPGVEKPGDFRKQPLAVGGLDQKNGLTHREKNSLIPVESL